MFDKSFYPTPKPLIKRMIGKIQLKEPWRAKVLEPSAGKGDIVEVLSDQYDYDMRHAKYHKENISVIEINEDLQATLRGKNWLPHEYGRKPYQEMESDEKAVVDSFEGVESYNEHLNQAVFARKELKYLLT